MVEEGSNIDPNVNRAITWTLELEKIRGISVSFKKERERKRRRKIKTKRKKFKKRENLQNIKFTILKCVIQWLTAYL